MNVGTAFALGTFMQTDASRRIQSLERQVTINKIKLREAILDTLDSPPLGKAGQVWRFHENQFAAIEDSDTESNNQRLLFTNRVLDRYEALVTECQTNSEKGCTHE